MGVFIKGMEMPKDDNWITVRIYPDGTCGRPDAYGDCALYNGAKAVPVPPHGDLIDRDALETDTEWDDREDGYISYSRVAIECAPTIIESTIGQLNSDSAVNEANANTSNAFNALDYVEESEASR